MPAIRAIGRSGELSYSPRIKSSYPFLQAFESHDLRSVSLERSRAPTNHVLLQTEWQSWIFTPRSELFFFGTKNWYKQTPTLFFCKYISNYFFNINLIFNFSCINTRARPGHSLENEIYFQSGSNYSVTLILPCSMHHKSWRSNTRLAPSFLR